MTSNENINELSKEQPNPPIESMVTEEKPQKSDGELQVEKVSSENSDNIKGVAEATLTPPEPSSGNNDPAPVVKVVKKEQSEDEQIASLLKSSDLERVNDEKICEEKDDKMADNNQHQKPPGDDEDSAAIASGDFIIKPAAPEDDDAAAVESDGAEAAGEDENNEDDDDDDNEPLLASTTRVRGRGVRGRGGTRLAVGRGGGAGRGRSPLNNAKLTVAIDPPQESTVNNDSASISPNSNSNATSASTSSSTSSEDEPLISKAKPTPPPEKPTTAPSADGPSAGLRRSTRKQQPVSLTTTPPALSAANEASISTTTAPYQGRLRRSQTMPPAPSLSPMPPPSVENLAVKTEPHHQDEAAPSLLLTTSSSMSNNEHEEAVKLRNKRRGADAALVISAAKQELQATVDQPVVPAGQQSLSTVGGDGDGAGVTKKLRRAAASASLKRCEACGIEAASVTALRFGSGRFCSKTCVGLFANKHRHRVRSKMTADGEFVDMGTNGELSPSAETSPLPPAGDEASLGGNNNNNNNRSRKRQSLGANHAHQNNNNKRTRASLPPAVVDDHNSNESSNASTSGASSALSDHGAASSSNNNSSSMMAPVLPTFDWQEYLKETNSQPVPKEAFRNAFPPSSSSSFFQVNQRLEGIDPRHPSLFCVLSVAQVVGFRIRLHFDGFSSSHDFWTNADSPYLFPCGWTEKSGRRLQMPKGWKRARFNWPAYLRETNSTAAPSELFASLRLPAPHPGLKRGQKLEAVDKTNTLLTCVASLADFFGDRLLIHFDGWGDTYDFWTSATSPYLHAVGWCQDMGRALSPPQDYPDIENYTWEDYLAETGSESVPASVFKGRPPAQFVVGRKMEAVDRRNPSLIRVATVVESADYRVKLRYDGWPETYDIYVDDDCADIHPCGWATHVGHPLEAPPSISSQHCPPNTASSQSGGAASCPTYGCRGVGHVKGAKFSNHTSACGCPYANLDRPARGLVERLIGTESLPENASFLASAERPNNGNNISSNNNNNGTKSASKNRVLSRRHSSHGASATGDQAASQGGKNNHQNNNNNHHQGSSSSSKPMSRASEMADSVRRFIFNAPLRNGAVSANGSLNVPLSSSLIMDRLLEAINPDLALINKMQRNNAAAAANQQNNNNNKKTAAATKQEKAKMAAAAAGATNNGASSAGDDAVGDETAPMADGITPRLVATWNVQKVVEFVRSLPGCQQNSQAFADEQIDGAALLLLNQADMLKIMNMKLGPVLKIFSVIQAIKRAT